MTAKACRICLATDVKLYSIKREPLKTAVEIILTLNGDPSSFPQFMCYLCSAIIIKCLKFIEKSRISEIILYDIYDMQGEVPLSALRAVNRQSSNLESNIKIHNCPPNTYIETQHYGIEQSPSNSSVQHHENAIEIQHITIQDAETFDERDLILTFDDDSGKDDTNEVDLENEILFEAGKQESLFSYDVELKLENTKFESISLSMPDNNGASKKENKKEKQTKPKTKRKESGAKQPKSKDKRKDVQKKVRKEKKKKVKDFDEKLKQQSLIHMKKHQGDKKVLHCSHCKFVAECRSRVFRHVRARHAGGGAGGVAWRCACGARFATPRGRAQHERAAHRPPRTEKGNSCEICALTFKMETELKKHVRDKHWDYVDKSASNYCKKCNEKFMNVADYAEHNAGLHRSENIYPVTCSHCTEVIRSSREYWRHVVRSHPSEKQNYHSPKRSFLCDVCGKGFKSVTELRLHAARHGAGRRVACDLCPRLFYDAYQARAHRRIVHSDQRPHKCPICELKFKIKSNLNRHMVVHTGVRAYTCSLCDKSFTQASSRDVHVRSVHYKIRIPHPKRSSKKQKKTAKAAAKSNAEDCNAEKTLQVSYGDRDLVNEASEGQMT